MKKLFALVLAFLMMAALLAGCGTASSTPGGNSTPDPNAGGNETTDPTDDPNAYVPPASDIIADITILMWSGDDAYLQDIGHSEFAPEDLKGQNQAAAYAVAKAFNEIYPNVTINILAHSGDPNDGTPWTQKIENFNAEYGKYPDLYAAQSVGTDLEKGLPADLSVFANDPAYKTFNENLMSICNYNGAQLGLPQYSVPWGVAVNYTLANAKNIDIPSPNWTIDEYTDFISHSEQDVYYGAWDVPMDILRSGTQDFSYNLAIRGNNDPYVKMDSEAVFSLLDYVPVWAQHTTLAQHSLGLVSDEFMNSPEWWDLPHFAGGSSLTLSGHASGWAMGNLGNPDEAAWMHASFDYDIYPRPSTDYVGNTVGVLFDPFCVHNYAMDDGNPEMNDEEYAKTQIAYELAKFWCTDTRAFKARADQMWIENGSLKTALNDSFPMVTGAEFDAQMEIWYSVETHKVYADAEKMPGFQEVLRIWENGEFNDVSDKVYPWNYDFEGTVRPIMYEWENMNNPEIVGAARTDANWVDNMKSRLPEWNKAFNQRWEEKFVRVNEALATYYGK